jgi:hypothetical protein
MTNRIDSINREFKELRKVAQATVPVRIHRDNKKVRCEKRIFALRNIASEALNNFIMHEYDNVR